MGSSEPEVYMEKLEKDKTKTTHTHTQHTVKKRKTT
jgi:hypothetical protein